MFKDLLGDRKVQHKGTKRWKWQVQVLWDNDEKTWKPVHVVRKDDPLSMVKYAHDNKLVKTNGWKWVRKYKSLIQRYADLITRVNAFRTEAEV